MIEHYEVYKRVVLPSYSRFVKALGLENAPRQGPEENDHLKNKFSCHLPSQPIFILLARKAREFFCELAKEVHREQNLVQNSAVVGVYVDREHKKTDYSAHKHIALFLFRLRVRTGLKILNFAQQVQICITLKVTGTRAILVLHFDVLKINTNF